jgi:glyoxylase-like metal-dependent hydrolase (beta-lactamase superfamily II)
LLHEAEMTKSALIFDRRTLLRTSTGIVASAALSVALPDGSRAETAAQAGTSHPHGSGFYRFKVGDFAATVISDGYGSIPLRPLLAPNASEADFKELLKANFMGPTVQGTSNILVVDTGSQRILVDSGWGEKLGPAFGNFSKLQTNLQRAGITADSIDLVVVSHGHLDHVGGLVTKSGAPAFPKATYVFVDTEWNYWTGKQFEADVAKSPMPDPIKQGTVAAAKDNLPPIASRSRFVKQGSEIATGVNYVAAPGHSPAHAAILFSAKNEQLLHLADVVHNPVTSIQHPEWTPVFDYDPVLSIKTRKSILNRVASERLLAMGYHFPFPGLGHVVRQGNGYRWVPTQWVW